MLVLLLGIRYFEVKCKNTFKFFLRIFMCQPVPVLLKRMSTFPPPSSIARFTRLRAIDKSNKSVCTKSDFPPVARISATLCSPRSALCSATTTWMPRAAKLFRNCPSNTVRSPCNNCCRKIGIQTITSFAEDIKMFKGFILFRSLIISFR